MDRKNNLLLVAALLFLLACQPGSKGIRVVFTGDVLLDRGVNDQLRLHGDSLLVNAFAQLGKPNHLVVNLEGTFATNHSMAALPNRSYSFKVDAQRAELLARGGVAQVSVANNHAWDYGSAGFSATIQTLINHRLTPLGETGKPIILKANGHRYAVLSASLSSHNDSLPISSAQGLQNSIRSFRAQYAQVPLVLYLHWGLELQSVPEPWQRQLAAELTLLGADAIIGHHPHVVQTIEFVNGKPVFYSLGNFVADAYLPGTNRAYAVELFVSNQIDSVGIRLLDIPRYFPYLLSSQQQFAQIAAQLGRSQGIAALYQQGVWTIKPSATINFTEPTRTWAIAQGGSVALLHRLQTGSHLVRLYTNGQPSNTVNLHGELTECHIADINNDHHPDLLLGIGKKVKFDPVVKKRVNIYSCQNGVLQALWLGTKFISDVEHFGTKRLDGINYLLTNERDSLGNPLQRLYEWDDFGFALKQDYGAGFGFPYPPAAGHTTIPRCGLPFER